MNVRLNLLQAIIIQILALQTKPQPRQTARALSTGRLTHLTVEVFADSIAAEHAHVAIPATFQGGLVLYKFLGNQKNQR